MNRTLRTFAALVAGALLAACASVAPPPAPTPRPLTVLVSIDGFRPDYLDRGVTPTLSALAARGVRAAMRPSFPSKTFPNHYTLVTGLRPDRNGIVDKVPVGRLGRPSEIARTVAFLSDDEAGYITGANIPVNGGLFMSF